MDMEHIKVSIFEDNKHLRESLYYLIHGTNGLTCVGQHPDCSDLEFVIGREQPDVVLMDIEMPGINGIEGVRQLKQHFPHIQVLMQTIFQDDEHIFQAICAGASGYLLKTTSPAGYIDAIRDVYNGGSPMTGSIARKVLTLFQQTARPSASPDYQLTAREKEILSLMVQGMSFKLIADASSVSYETVRTHMKSIYHKLHVNSNTEAVSKALRERIV